MPIYESDSTLEFDVYDSAISMLRIQDSDNDEDDNDFVDSKTELWSTLKE